MRHPASGDNGDCIFFDPLRLQIPFARNPPSTGIVWPVTKEDASLARKIAHPTSSSTLPTRPIGVRAIIEEMRAGISSALVFSGVRNTPGAIAFTRTPCVAHSQARLLVSMCTPALLAATSAKLTNVVMEHVLII